jgi:hypothetical protein
MGLPGIQISGAKDWCEYPVALPDGWAAIEVDQVFVRGRPMRLRAAQGAAKASLEAIA